MNRFIIPVKSIALITIFVWIGFISSISFMEAWLKFQAEGVTLPIGLSIGRLIFAAMNKVEWVFAMIALIFITKKNTTFFFFFLSILLLAIQTYFLLPGLSSRVDIVLQREALPPSFLHFYYLGIEVAKVFCLFACGLSLLKEILSKSLRSEDFSAADSLLKTTNP